MYGKWGIAFFGKGYVVYSNKNAVSVTFVLT